MATFGTISYQQWLQPTLKESLKLKVRKKRTIFKQQQTDMAVSTL